MILFENRLTKTILYKAGDEFEIIIHDKVLGSFDAMKISRFELEMIYKNLDNERLNYE